MRLFLVIVLMIFLSPLAVDAQAIDSSKVGTFKRDTNSREQKILIAKAAFQKGMLFTDQQMNEYEQLSKRRTDYIKALAHDDRIKNKDSVMKKYDKYYQADVRRMLNPEQLKRWDQLQEAKKKAVIKNRKMIDSLLKRSSKSEKVSPEAKG